MNSESDKISWSAQAGREVCLCGIGARTPLGFGAAASAAAVRGAISAIAVHPVFVDKIGEPVALARDAALDIKIEIGSRMEQMVVSAIAEALGESLDEQGRSQIQCWVGLPEPRPGLPSELGRSLSTALSNSFGIESTNIHVLPRGHAAGLMAMQVAAQRISSGAADLCVAAGVDSYHDIATLKWLDLNRRLMSSKNRNGYPPSEGAGACLLASRSTADHYGLAILAMITATSTCMEPHAIQSGEVCVGEGLSAALKDVSSSLQLPQEAITATYCDLNGERYRNEEFLYTLLRVQSAFVNPNDYLCPADCWGDVGAASGPLFACLAAASSERGYAKGLRPVLWAGSESGHRTAVLLKLGKS
jgi:3-oxoacyl-[acyl-carrier-protein] synthase-1